MFLGFGDDSWYWTASYCLDASVMNYNGDSSIDELIAVYPTPGDHTMAFGDILSVLDDVNTSSKSNYWTDLRDKLAGGAGENFYDLTTEEDGTWPIIVTVTNDVFANRTYIMMENGDRSVNVSYLGTFEPGSPLSFAFTNDVQKTGSESEGFEIYNIEVIRTVSNISIYAGNIL